MLARLLPAVAVIVLGLAGIAAAVAFFGSRDDATVPPAAQGPGSMRSTGAKPVVAPGNVMLAYRDARVQPRLTALALRIGGPPDAALEAAGQAVVLRRMPGQGVAIRALSARHELTTDDPGDPSLAAFVEYWLGREPG